jgi:hypothetical protein
VPLAVFVTSPIGLAPAFIEGSDLYLNADAIQLSSDRGLRTDLEGSLWTPFGISTELDRSGIALGEVGFSLIIWLDIDEL